MGWTVPATQASPPLGERRVTLLVGVMVNVALLTSALRGSPASVTRIRHWVELALATAQAWISLGPEPKFWLLTMVFQVLPLSVENSMLKKPVQPPWLQVMFWLLQTSQF